MVVGCAYPLVLCGFAILFFQMSRCVAVCGWSWPPSSAIVLHKVGCFEASSRLFLPAGVVRWWVKWMHLGICDELLGRPAMPSTSEKRSLPLPPRHPWVIFVVHLRSVHRTYLHHLLPLPFRILAGPRRMLPVMWHVLSAFAVVLTSTSGVSYVCSASLTCSCFVFSSSKSSLGARSLLSAGDDWGLVPKLCFRKVWDGRSGWPGESLNGWSNAIPILCVKQYRVDWLWETWHTCEGRTFPLYRWIDQLITSGWGVRYKHWYKYTRT
jgi:hypothetical protein